MTYSSSIHSIVGYLRQISVTGGSQPSVPYHLSTNQDVVLGRDASCQIILDYEQYPSISRRHAAIRPRNPASGHATEWVVYDLNSSYGTYINGQRLQGSQALQDGDRMTLSPDGPQFIFECQQSQPRKTSQNAGVQGEVTKIKNFWIEQSPTHLVIHLEKPLPEQQSLLYRGRWIAFLVFFIILSVFAFIFGIFFLLFAIWRRPVAYIFDLDNDQLTVTSQCLLDRMFNKYGRQQYPLSSLTAVRLVRSKYQGNADTRYNTYNISLKRVSGKAINLSGLANKLRNDQEAAQQLVDIIDHFLSEDI